MIGKIRFPQRGRFIEAILHEDGYWECPALPCLKRPLDIRFGPAWHEVPTDSVEGFQLLVNAAHWLRGAAIVETTFEMTVTLQTVISNYNDTALAMGVM